LSSTGLYSKPGHRTLNQAYWIAPRKEHNGFTSPSPPLNTQNHGPGECKLYLLSRPGQDALSSPLPEDMDTSYARVRKNSSSYAGK